MKSMQLMETLPKYLYNFFSQNNKWKPQIIWTKKNPRKGTTTCTYIKLHNTRLLFINSATLIPPKKNGAIIFIKKRKGKKIVQPRTCITQ